MKIIVSFCISLLLSSASFANEIAIVEPSTDALDQFLDEDINFKSLDSLSDVLDTDDQKYKKYIPKEFIRKTPQTPTKLYAVLMKQSPIYEVNGEKVLKNKEKLFVSAREVFYGGKWSYIYNKKNEIKYKTLTKNLAFIEEVIKIRSTIPGNKIYPKKSRYHIVDRTIPVEFHLLYRSETTDFKSLNTLASSKLEAAKSNSISLKGYFNSLLPIDFGMAFDYQSGKAESDSESIIWKAISIGPTIKYDFFKTTNFNFNTQFAVKKSLSFNASSELGDAQLSSLAWIAGIEGVYKTNYGNLSLGFESSFIKTSIKGELQGQSSFSNEKESMNQNAFTVGYQYTWML
ncbi:hypothetical protein [Halobacteriovorax sp. JY17]|uniref:hypothetical protein n=1 Tax=Halobacteriovorax sp. JY17 TaxID=2014617 RepID=UPI000C5915BF|nr:hypothetical protein [Halobacteriovorax sp. JY17]PIK14750.1 MAG: hypothetical protein CES88_10450 [Halobacteriovorax sp. JY17]